MKITGWGLIVALAIPAGTALAGRAAAQQSAQDSQQDSLAAASRRARENKTAQPKAAKVWDNDNMPNNPGALSVVGQAAPEASTPPATEPNKTDASATAAGTSDQSGAAKPAAPGGPAAGADNKTALQADLAAAKDQLQSLTTDLDILQRKFTLDQQVYYGKPNYSADKAGAASLKDEQDQIDAKQQEIADAQKKIDDLQSRIDAAANSADRPKPPS